MKQKMVAWIAILMMIILSVPYAMADVVEPGDDFWYLDDANVLSEETEGLIYFANRQLYEAAGAEIVVVAIDDTGRLSTQDYAYTLFNDWGIGGENDRGFLLLLSIEDDDYYGMLGTMLEPFFDSATVAEYLDTYLEPDFAEKKYDVGVRKFFEATYNYVVNTFNLDLSLQDAEAEYKAFIASNSADTLEDRDENIGSVVHVERHRGGFNLGAIVVIIVLIIILINLSRAKRVVRSTGFGVRPVRRSPSLFWPMVIRSTMRRPPHNPPPPPGGFGSHGPFTGPGRPSSNTRPGGMFGSSGRSTGFGGAGGFGGVGRSTSSRPSVRSGFGGASRSGGARGGTRGGGAGRGGRR